MRAARIHSFGSPEVIVLEEMPKPVPAAGEVLVRIKAAGVGPWDGLIRTGKSALPQPLPLTLGSDIAGTVEAMGAGVSGLSVGDAVFGVSNARFTDGYAEYAAASAGMIARKPRKLVLGPEARWSAGVRRLIPGPGQGSRAWRPGQLLPGRRKLSDARAARRHDGRGRANRVCRLHSSIRRGPDGARDARRPAPAPQGQDRPGPRAGGRTRRRATARRFDRRIRDCTSRHRS